jgi:PP-loop superfamily ATP-utilizing enzyme
MYLLQIELAHTIQAEKLREVERHRRIQEALAVRQRRSRDPARALVYVRHLITTIVTSSKGVVEPVKS